MSSQQIIHRIGVQFIQPLINLIGILDFGNILGRSQNLFAVQNCCHLLQRKDVLLNGQRTRWFECGWHGGAWDLWIEVTVKQPTSSAISATQSMI